MCYSGSACIKLLCKIRTIWIEVVKLRVRSKPPESSLLYGESGWRGHHSRFPPLRPGIDSRGPHVGGDLSPSLSDSQGFSPGTPVFLPLQIRLSRQDLSRQAIKY